MTEQIYVGATHQLGSTPGQIVSPDCMMGLDYYEDAPFAELRDSNDSNFETWMATAEGKVVSGVVIAMQFLRPVGAVVAGIHGYRRNDSSWGAAFGWTALGFLFPVVTNIVGLAQGYGRPKEEAGNVSGPAIRGRRRSCH